VAHAAKWEHHDAVTPGLNGQTRHVRRRDLVAILAALVVLALVVVGAATYAARQNSERVRTVALSHDPGNLQDTTTATVDSLRQFWSDRLPATYHRAFEDLRGGFRPERPGSPPFSCGRQRQTYDDIRGNAFYCPPDDYIAYDAALLFPRLDRFYGNVSPAIVLAHEMGHAVQNRASVQGPSIVIELQADCFAGAWVKFAQRSDKDPVTVVDRALDSGMAAMLTLRDQPGTPVTNPKAHGLGFDRVNAFQTGYDGSTGACATFPARGVFTTELPFQTVKEALTGGNLPYDTAVPVFSVALDGFWTGALPTLVPRRRFVPPTRLPLSAAPLPVCRGARAYDPRTAIAYCPVTNTVAWVDPVLRQVHDTLGDYSTATLLSEAWGRAGQTQAGLPVDGARAGLQRDCFTGAWVSAIASSGAAQLLLSPGDLDEVLLTILVTSFDPRSAPTSRGTAFERTEALRRGVLSGLAACH
jgi:predicted metalloprotease